MADDDDVTNELQSFRETLGPEFEYLADGLAPAVKQLAERTFETREQERELKAQQTKAAEERTATVMTTFGERHADWQEHEPAMMKLAQSLDLKPGAMTELEFLEHLYRAATHETWEKERNARIAEASETASADTEPARDRAPRSFEDCYRAAQRGERFDADRSADATPRVTEHPRARGRALSFRDAYEAAKRGERVE